MNPERVIFQMRPRPAVPPGHFPTELLDQQDAWVNPGGYLERIAEMPEDKLVFYINFLMGTAKRLREQWSVEQQQTFDTEQHARVWILHRPATTALFRRLVEVRDRAHAQKLSGAFDAEVDPR